MSEDKGKARGKGTEPVVARLTAEQAVERMAKAMAGAGKAYAADGKGAGDDRAG